MTTPKLSYEAMKKNYDATRKEKSKYKWGKYGFLGGALVSKPWLVGGIVGAVFAGTLGRMYKAYKESIEDYNNIKVTFTKEAQTADHFIEKFVRVNKNNYRITVATSDGMQQIVVRGAGANVISARELKERIYSMIKEIREKHLEGQQNKQRFKIEDTLMEEKFKKK